MNLASEGLWDRRAVVGSRFSTAWVFEVKFFTSNHVESLVHRRAVAPVGSEVGEANDSSRIDDDRRRAVHVFRMHGERHWIHSVRRPDFPSRIAQVRPPNPATVTLLKRFL